MKNLIREIEVKYKRTEISDTIIRKSFDAYLVFKEFWDENTIDYKETVNVLFLNKRHKPIGINTHSIGGLDTCIVDIREIFSIALKCKASAIVVAHNHPSGQLLPSNADINITRKLKTAGEVLNIDVLDHIIITSDSYYSIFENGHC